MKGQIMKKKLLLFPTLLLMLAACGNTSSLPEASNTPSDNTTSQTSNSQAPTTTEIITTSEEEESLPPLPSIVEKQTVTFASALPAGWTYISNDPEKYPDLNPDQDWYKDGGFKFRFTNQALKTPVFTSTYTKVTISGGLNANTRKDGGPTTIALYTINGSTETLVDSISFPADSANTYTKVFNVNPGANQFLIKMTGNVGYNVNLRTVIFE